MIKLPPPTGWNQPNNGNFNGSIYISKNLDLTKNVGRLMVSPRLVLNTSTADESTMTGTPCGFRMFNPSGAQIIYMIAGSNAFPGYVFQGSLIPGLPTGTFSHMTGGGGTGAPSGIDSIISDIEVFNNELYVTPDGANMSYLDGSNVWHTVATGSVSNGFSRPLCAPSFLPRLYTSIDGVNVISMDKTHAVAAIGANNTVSVANKWTERVITFMEYTSTRIWIGTVSQNGGRGFVYAWDGAQTTVNESYQLKAGGALSCVIEEDKPVIMDTNGALLEFNGGTFVEVAKLNRINKKVLFNAFGKNNNRFIHPNGMDIIDGRINLVIDGSNFDGLHNGTQDETIPSGVWEYTKETGLYHKTSVGLTKAGGTITDYGQSRVLGAGAIREIITGSAGTPIITDGKYLVGMSYFTDATTTTNGVFYDNTLNTLAKSGYLITPKIQGSSVEDVWQKAYAILRPFVTNTDSISIKYAVSQIDPTEGTATWQNSLSFITSTDVSAYGVGDEVEIIQGIGAGMSANITAIQSLSGSKWLVTVDTTMNGSLNSTALVRFQHWIKTDPASLNGLQYKEYSFIANASWIRLKIQMNYTGGDEIDSILIINSGHKSTT